ncbi:MAG: low molecular weight protein-tyrosine-phosphatase [Pseudomonadota bacterium]
MTTRVLFICLGNICRSPTAEAVARQRLEGLPFEFDSAGTGNWHAGNTPDPRSITAGEARGYDFSGIRARQVLPADFHRFEHLVAMDRDNLETLHRMRPLNSRAQLHLMMDFTAGAIGRDVPDPYYRNDGFDDVLDIIEHAVEGLGITLAPPQLAD